MHYVYTFHFTSGHQQVVETTGKVVIGEALKWISVGDFDTPSVGHVGLAMNVSNITHIEVEVTED